ncbi:hypothetical protein [Janthinobacterium sp.]|uniref:hypothetical protein n=1 Tax=Janthinobacterium sp. TaxID=1871054 RepID=UPI00293D49A3|nr:hypothetical protein [Janthinobacterium sp.]
MQDLTPIRMPDPDPDALIVAFHPPGPVRALFRRKKRRAGPPGRGLPGMPIW